MTTGALQALTSVEPELIAEGLGFPEGPVAMPDGSFVCVDSYRGQLTNLGADKSLALWPGQVERPIPV